jgi:predicted metal-dependent hydrolase
VPPTEPSPPDPTWPRYTSAPFPPYRYVPGQSPHPRTDPRGHSYGRPEPRARPIDPDAWAASALYLRGVDLFNFAYWWESHEAFEALWRVAPPESATFALLQALIQIAASELKRFSGVERGARALGERAQARLARVPSPHLGLDVRALSADLDARLAGARALPLLLALPLPRAVAGPMSSA